MPKTPRLAALDLNLLVVFDAIMRERSVTRAGERLGLSQPAMSHALTRLRHMLKDELFIRSPTGMTPTPRADELATPIRVALDGLQQSLEPVQFDPAKTAATFRIAVDNYAAIVLVAPIAAHVAGVAPGVRLDFRPSGTLDVLEQLVRSIRTRFCRKCHWKIKAWPQTGDACAILVGLRDPGNFGLGNSPSAERCQEHDQVAPARLPSIVTSPQTDRSSHDLVATARQPARACVAA